MLENLKNGSKMEKEYIINRMETGLWVIILMVKGLEYMQNLIKMEMFL